MLPLRLIVVAGIAAVIGCLLSLLARKRDKAPAVLASCIGSAVLGCGAAGILQMTYPALYDNLFTSSSWFEWVELVPSVFALLLLPRSLTVMAVGLFAGFVIARPGKLKRSYLAVALFVATFLGTWMLSAEHLPSGVEASTYAYRIYDVEDFTNDELDAHADAWVSFLEWSLTPHTGYESFSYSTVKSMPDRFGGAFDKPTKGDKTTYVFVKEYWKDGKQVATISTTRQGFMTTGELQSAFREMTRSRCSPGR